MPSLIPKIAGIPDPQPNLQSLMTSVLAIKEALETLIGQKPNMQGRAAYKAELEDLNGLVVTNYNTLNNYIIAVEDAIPTTEEIQDLVGDMVSGGTETGISVSYNDVAGKLDFVLDSEWLQDLVGAMVSGNVETNLTVTYDDTNGKLDFALSNSPTISGTLTSTGGNIATTGGALVVDRTGDAASANVVIQADAGLYRGVQFYTGSTIRWWLSMEVGAESGANAGGNMSLYHYTDAGSFLGTAWTVNRATGLMTVGAGFEVSGSLGATITESIQDIAGAMVTGGTETGISVSYDDTNARFDFVVDTEWVQDLVGAMINTTTGLTVTYDDPTGKINYVLDSDLVALANNASTGFWNVTGVGTGAVRTFSATAPMAITNGGGGGNPVISVGAASTSASGVVTLATQAQIEAETTGVVPTAAGLRWHPGAAKAWANITYSASTPSVNASHNVISIADTATGRVTINWDTDFSSANYSCLATVFIATGTARIMTVSSYAAGSVIIDNYSIAGALTDGHTNVAAFGDQ